MSEADSVASGDPAVPVAPLRTLPFKFGARGGEYFRIWIVNLLLTIVTLGIYSAWAKVRRLRYFYGNTRLDGVAFDYHGRPIAILTGRLIAVGAYALFYVLAQVQPLAAIGFLPLFMFGVPWIIMKSRRFQMRMTSYRGIRFGFDGGYRGALTAYIGWPILAAITAYLLGGRMVWEKVRYLLGNSRYGTEHARFNTGPGPFNRCFLLAMGLSSLLVVAFVVAFELLARTVRAEADPENPLAHLLRPSMASVVLVLALTGIAIAAYYQKSRLNASFDGLEIGPHRVQSRLETWPLFWIYLSNFALIVLTLGLFSPWARVRRMKYQLTSLAVVARGDLDQFAAAAGDGTDAIGEEIGDFFDVDFGL